MKTKYTFQTKKLLLIFTLLINVVFTMNAEGKPQQKKFTIAK
jgi:hypothetical protein